MREIVHLQAGQCGNQIGAKVRLNLLFAISKNLIWYEIKRFSRGNFEFEVKVRYFVVFNDF
jgi:hypothetical protein